MAKEIERKYLFNGTPYDLLTLLDNSQPLLIEDYYLNEFSRIRYYSTRDEETAYMCTKSDGTLVRNEYDYALQVPPRRCELPGRPLVKNRYKIYVKDICYEINVYRDYPLILVECELDSIEDISDKPSWLGNEVTEDKNFYNYSLWKKLQGIEGG